MSRSDLHTEENFWPCVSDMFLAFFVIALVLYSTAGKKWGDGDRHIDEQLVEEACEFFDDLSKYYPHDRSLKDGLDTLKDEKKQNSRPKQGNEENDHPILAGKLCALTAENSPIRPFLEAGTEPISEKKYQEAIVYLYEHTGGKQSPIMNEESPYGDGQMRLLRRHLIGRIRNELTGNLSPEHMAERIRALEQDNAKLRQSTISLEEHQRLLREKEEELQKLKEMIHHLGYGDLVARLNHLEQEKGLLQNRLNSILKQDKRGEVMEKVRTILDSQGLTQAVHVEKEQGIIRIPAETISFVVNKSDKLTEAKQLEVLKSLSQALVAIAEQDKEDRLIDNIVLECHADQTGDAEENESLSSERAVWVWKTLNQASGQKLESYRNSSGLGLFSHAGFGCRVPVNRNPGESNRDFWTRCRRIDIRFNCSPQIQDTGEQNQEAAPSHE